MIKRNSIDLLISMFFVLNAIRNIFIFSGLLSVATVVFFAIYFLIALLIVVVIYDLFKRPLKVNLFTIASIVLIISLIIIPMQYDRSVWIYNDYSHITFFMTIVFLIFSKRIFISNRTIEIGYKVSVIQALFAIACSFMLNSYEDGALVLNYGNPNQTAIALWIVFSFCFLYWRKKKHSHRISIALCLVMFATAILIYLTDSRAVLLSIIITLVLFFVTKRKRTIVAVPNTIQSILCLSPILIPTITIALVKALPSNIMFLGKLLFSGREKIWEQITDAFFAQPFTTHLDTSPYFRYALENGHTVAKAMGAHNGTLALLWYYGILVLVLFLIIMAILIKNAKHSARISANAGSAYIIVLASLFSLSFEEGMILGNLCTSLYLPLLLIICQSEEYLDEKH